MKNMMLITSTWKGGKTFKLIPTTSDTAFVEGIYDGGVKVLALVGNNKKDTFHMLPKIDPNGDNELRKTPAKDGNPYKQERRTLETYHEYYIEERQEIIDFVKAFAINADSFDIVTYLDAEPAVTEALPEGLQQMMKV